jgi:hypothetical protein
MIKDYKNIRYVVSIFFFFVNSTLKIYYYKTINTTDTITKPLILQVYCL